MSFKRISLAICSAFATVTLAGATSPAESFIAAQFATPPEASSLVLSGEAAAVIREILGYPFPQEEIAYWEGQGKTVWILEGRGRSNRITAGFVVRDGGLERAEVLVYRESRGRQVRSRSFLRQFEGALLTKDRRLDRRVDGITGATLSVNVLHDLVRWVLYLDSVREAPSRTP